jgi:hypothetical protein
MAPVGTEGYLSMFTYPKAFRTHVEVHRGVGGYVGATGAPYIWLDFDGVGALDDVRRLCIFLEERMDEGGNIAPLLFFSGNKGYHVGIAAEHAAADPGPLFHTTAREFVSSLASDAGAAATLDVGIYDAVRLFRAPNSRHPRTGLHKIPLEAAALLRLSESRIRDLARAPREFELPESPCMDFGLARRWDTAKKAAEFSVARQTDYASASASGKARLNPSTREFLRDGAAPSERATRLFAASANLSECGAPPRLVAQLLEESGLDTGLADGCPVMRARRVWR